MPFQTRRVGGDKNRAASLKPWLSLASVTLFSVRMSKPLFAWYRHWKERRAAIQEERRAATLLKRILIVLLSVLLGVFLLAGAVKALVSLRILSFHTIAAVAGKQLPVDENGYTNFLLLGKGDDGHDGIDLTDTMMIASIDAKNTKSAVLVSIPRDLFITDPQKMARGRINELYRDYKSTLRQKGMTAKDASQEAMQELALELGRRLHIQIHHVVMVDFIGFIQAVDAIGGLDVTVPYDLVDTQYPGPDYSYETFSVNAGPQHFDGETALKYARSRHSTSDFDRSARQQQILQILAQKAKDTGLITNPSKVTELWRIISAHADTTMTFGEIIGAADLAKQIDHDRIISVQLNNETGFDTGMPAPGGFLYNPPRDQFNGASVLLPISIPEFPVTWKQLQVFMTVLLQNRAIYLNRPQISILNAGAKTGMGRKLGDELTRYVFHIGTIANSSNGKRDTSVILALTEEDHATASFFGSLLHLPVEVAPPGSVPNGLSQVTIVLGKDYTYRPLQNLLPPLP